MCNAVPLRSSPSLSFSLPFASYFATAKSNLTSRDKDKRLARTSHELILSPNKHSTWPTAITHFSSSHWKFSFFYCVNHSFNSLFYVLFNMNHKYEKNSFSGELQLPPVDCYDHSFLNLTFAVDGHSQIRQNFLYSYARLIST